jgi:hypothetical protein
MASLPGLSVLAGPSKGAARFARDAALNWLRSRSIPKKALDIGVLAGGAALAPGALNVLGNIYGVGKAPAVAPTGAPGTPPVGGAPGDVTYPPAPILPSPEELDRQEAQQRGQERPPAGPAPGSEREAPATGPLAEKGLGELAEILKLQLSPEYQEEKLQREIKGALIQRVAADQAAMEKSRERTRREIEKQVLQSWQARETALINRDAAILMGIGSTIGSVYPADALRRGADLLNTGDITIRKAF